MQFVMSKHSERHSRIWKCK